MAAEQQFRAFFAIAIPDHIGERVQAVCAELQQYPGFSNLRWVQREQLHITLRFLGTISEQQHQELLPAIRAQLQTIEPFTLKFNQLAFFPSPQAPRALVLKLKTLTNLVRLNQVLDRTVLQYKVQVEKHAFVPHLTLGRIKQLGVRELPQLEVPTFTLKVSTVELFKSEHDQEGTRYTVLERVELGK